MDTWSEGSWPGTAAISSSASRRWNRVDRSGLRSPSWLLILCNVIAPQALWFRRQAAGHRVDTRSGKATPAVTGNTADTFTVKSSSVTGNVYTIAKEQLRRRDSLVHDRRLVRLPYRRQLVEHHPRRSHVRAAALLRGRFVERALRRMSCQGLRTSGRYSRSDENQGELWLRHGRSVVAAMLLVMVALGVLKGLDSRAAQLRPREGPLHRRRAHRAGPGAAALLPRRRPRQLRRDAHGQGQQRRRTRVKSRPTGSATRPAARRAATTARRRPTTCGSPRRRRRTWSTPRSRRSRCRASSPRPSARSAPTRARSASRSTTATASVCAGVNVTITGPSTLSNPTNSAGCAIFAYVPVGAYTASVTHRRLGRQGRQPERQRRRDRQQRHGQRQDDRLRPGGQRAGDFDTETLAGATVPATTTQISASNAGVPVGAVLPLRRHPHLRPHRRCPRRRSRPPASSRSRTATASTAAAARVPTRPRTSPTTTTVPGRLRRQRPGCRGHAGRGPAALDQPRVLYNSLPIPITSPVTRIVVTSTTHELQRDVHLPGAGDRSGTAT